MNRLAFLSVVVLFYCILFLPALSLAQPPAPPQPSPAVPIDGGLGILIAAGIALGGKKIWDQKRDI